MAANRFATLIHRKTNRITLVLVYTFLEWSLIFFLLLNSLFSYLIIRFADCFGLKRPCLLCSRLETSCDKTHSHRDLLCDDHALEISNVPFKTNESNGFFDSQERSFTMEEETENKKQLPCETEEKQRKEEETEKKLPCETEEKQSKEETEKNNILCETEERQRKEEETEKKLLCETEEKQRKEEETEKKLPCETEDATSDDDETEEEEFSCYVSSFDFIKEVTKEEEEENRVDLAMEFEITQKTEHKQEESTSPARNLEFYIDDNDCHLIPIEFYKPTEEIREISDINGDFILDFAAAEEEENESASPPPPLPPHESKPDYSGSKLGMQMQNDEDSDAEVSIGTEIPNHDQIGDSPSSFVDSDEDHLHEEVTLEFKAMKPKLLEIENFHSLHNTMFHLDQRTEPESVEEKLKFELEEERKALNALYEELEEERSASAVAANETMAMINRLQEEKAAMQMEALQYQRMMEEQSEFDQEALQLLNEVIVKREKEKAELEKELKICRKRLEGSNGETEYTPIDVVLGLDDYEGERVSILGRLKFLEEKLAACNDEEVDEETFSINGNGHKHKVVVKAKRLLPLFDAVDGEMVNGNHQEKGEIVTVEEEVDEIYERLEALEADREFLRHCFGSLKKGDKGVHLLHEILQHLRDLKNIESYSH